MKRCACVIFLAVAMLAGFAGSAVAEEEPVSIPDHTLKAALEAYLGVSNPAPSDMLRLTSLSSEGTSGHLGDLVELTGLEYATNLVFLDIDHNKIVDLSPLSGLVKLEHLNIEHNQITDISALAGLKNLVWLKIEVNKVTDMSPLAGMTKLEFFEDHGGKISDISAMASMTSLQYANLGYSVVSDISPLAGLKNLVNVDLQHCALNEAAYCTYLAQIAANNPGAHMQYEDNPTPPQAVAASDGTYPDKVRITWNGVCNGPEGYKEPHYYIVYRSDSPTGTKTPISPWIYSNTSFDDASVSPGVHYWYWVTSTLSWEFAQGDEGFAGSGASHTLTTTSSAGGTVSTPGIGSFQYGLGTTVSVTATAGLNHHFLNWTGTAVTAGKVANATSASTTVTMDGDYTLQANFGIDGRTLTTSSTAGGTVSTPGIGSYSYDHGTSAPVAATAQANYYFVNWTGTAVTAGKVANASSANTTVTMDGNYTLQANFGIEGRTLTTSSTAGGTVRTPGIGLYRYDHGSLASVVATAEANYYFVNWTGSAVTSGKVANASSASTTVTMDGNYTLQANFAIGQQTLTTSAGSGGTVSTPGVGSFQYDHGTTVSVTAAAGANYHFVNWTGTAVTSGKVANSTSANTTVTMDSNYTLQANFAIGQQTLTTSAGSGGTVSTPGVGSFPYDHGTTVSVTAAAGANYHFVNWTGTAVTSGKVANASSANTTVTMDGNYTLQANFGIEGRTLTTSAGSGGTVSTPGVGSFQYDHGTTVSVAAAAASGYHFVNWTGTAVTSGKVANASSANTTVTMDGNYTLQANFAIGQQTLTTSAGSGGTVTAPGVGSFPYDHGTTVSVTAAAGANYHFVNWTGTAVTSGKVANASSASTTVTMDGDYTLQANFAIGQQTLTTSAGGGGTVTTPGVGSFQYDHGTTVSVTAAAASGYHFVNWTGTAATSGKVANATSANTTVTMDGDYTLQANFALDRHTLTTSAGSGGTVTTPGVGSFQYDHGTTVSVAAAAASGYHFVNWTGSAVTSGKVANASSANTTVTIDGDYTLQANFATGQRTLTTSAGSGGTLSTPGVGSFQYDHGTTVSVAAAAASGYHFANWTGTAVTSGKVANANSASTTVLIDGDYTLRANFAVDRHALTTSAGSGGTVSTPGVGSFQYDHGTTVSVVATAGANCHFVNWTGTAVTSGKVSDATSASTTVLIDGDYTLRANFEVTQYTLTITSTVGGSVVMPSSGVGSYTYPAGALVWLDAAANPLFKFAGWRGGLYANESQASITMTADVTVEAHFESLLDTIYVDDDAPGDLGPGDANVSDLNQNGTASHPLDGIQKAIAVAKKGAKIVILPGTYLETIDLLGKSIELDGLSCGDGVIGSFPVINGQGKGTVVTCTQGEGASCVLSGLVITGGRGRVAGGIVCSASSPSFVNCLIVGNHLSDPNDAGYIGESKQDVVNGGALYCRESSATFVNCTIAGNWGVSGGPALGFKDSRVILANSIVWGNGPVAMVAQGTQQPVVTYSDVSGGWVGTGNLNKDPLFAVPGFWASPKDLTKVVEGTNPAAVWVKGDYHLRSQTGRWDTVLGWVKDAVASPCIDAGDPASLIGQEPNPNGFRINLGVYGGTCQASKSGGAGS